MPEALNNALLRLGFGCGDQEFFTMAEAIQLISFERLGQSASRFDPQKLLAFNAHYLRKKPPEALLQILQKFLNATWSKEATERLLKGLIGLAERSKTLKDLAHGALLYTEKTLTLTPEAKAMLTPESLAYVQTYGEALSERNAWSAETLEAFTREFAETHNLKLGQLAKPLRGFLSGQKSLPPVRGDGRSGKTLTLKRLRA